MFSKGTELRCRLAERPDSEHIQAYLRVLAAAIGLTIVLAVHYLAQQSGGWGLATQLWVIVLGTTTGVFGLLVWIVASPAPNPLRRWIGVAHDMTWNGLALYALGDSGAVVFPMYIWVVIGNGFRYGLPYLYGSAALALVSFYTVAYFSPYYRANYGLLGLGTFLLAVVIPVYLGSLLKTLQRNLEAAREADRRSRPPS